MSHYQYAESYLKYNTKLADSLTKKFGAPVKVRAFNNDMMAVYDLCFGLLQFLSHRPKVGIIRLGSSLPDVLLPQFYRLQTPLIFKKENETFEQYISQFDHEVNFVIWSSENEITGEILLSDEKRVEMHKALSSKRIFSIEIKSNVTQADMQLLSASAYSVFLTTSGCFQNKESLILHTDKLKTPMLIGMTQDYFYNSASDANVEFDLNTESVLSRQQHDLQFFANSKFNYFNQFAVKPPHLKDRIVISSKKVSGDLLMAELGLQRNQVFVPSHLSLVEIESILAWWPEVKNSDLLMGLLVVNLNANVSLTQDFVNKIELACEKLTAQSTWSIS